MSGERMTDAEFEACVEWATGCGQKNSAVPDLVTEARRARERETALEAERDEARAEVERLRALLVEARDNATASTAETGITEERRRYRLALADRITAALGRATPDR